MDPFTQRMLERARARQEKIDQKLANSGQIVPKRKPLAENLGAIKNESPVKSPMKNAKETIVSPRRMSNKSETPSKTVTRRSSANKEQVSAPSPQKSRNDVVVTKKEFKSGRGSLGRRNSDVSLEINIMHSKDITVDVQIEERDASMSITYPTEDRGSNVVIKEIEEDTSKMPLEMTESDPAEHKSERTGLRTNVKSRLDRLGNLYSDAPNLSSPIHRTESHFSSATPPKLAPKQETRPAPEGKRKFGRFAALADQINNWEDDLTHHNFHPEPAKKTISLKKAEPKNDKLESSTLDVSIHSLRDINKVLQSNTKASQFTKTNTYNKSSVNECQRLQREIVAELEPKLASTTPSADPAPDMATMVASSPPNPAISKKPSIKKYRAPTPPRKIVNDSEKDKENNVVQHEENDNDANDCIQTKQEPADQKPASDKGSPVVKRLAPKLNGNVDRSSVLSKAAMFEAGSPKAKDPAEMTLRERKALFEKNKGTAIIPKAPFGMAPSVKTLLGDNKVDTKKQTSAKTTPTKSNSSSRCTSRTNSKDNLADDNISQSSLGGGIKGKLAALFNKEQTISESTIANKFKQEREKEMEMLQNRFQFKPKTEPPEQHANDDSDDDHSDTDPSEKVPLMGSVLSLTSNKKPEIIANVPKVTFDNEPTIREGEKEKDRVVGAQPVKRRSSQSQDSPVVLSVLDDVKRIKVNDSKKNPQTNGAITQQPSLYPHLSDIETDTSHTQEEYSDCGGSRCGHYTLECIFFFLCI